MKIFAIACSILLLLGLFLFPSFAPRVVAQNPTTISHLLVFRENRVDLDGDGSWDHYWASPGSSASNTCTLSLYRLSDKSLRWTTSPISNCLSFYPIFHWRSFMGSSERDFTINVKGPATDRDWHLLAGDGATGRIRNFDLFMGDSQGAGVTRIQALATIDLKLSTFPGPALAVRTNGANSPNPPDPGSHFHARLFYFPSADNSFVELTTNSSVIQPDTPWVNFPFPGADLPTSIGNFDDIYNNFNPVPCLLNNIFNRCGVPDDRSGKGGFMGKLMVGDIDADGVEDLHTTYWSVHQVYPGRPKGQVANLGAPMYHMWYDPQSDIFNPSCHDNRHYGLSVLTQVDADPYLEMVDLGGNIVNDFLDPYQNIVRNVGLIDMGPNSQNQLVRTVKWNRPMHVTQPGCTPNLMYKDSLHYPSYTLIEDSSGRTKYIQFNRFTQLTQAENCAHSDFDCHLRVMASMTGYWNWEFINAANGDTTLSYRNNYLWDVIPGPNTNKLWVLYSAVATNWNLGYTDTSGTTPLLRNDLTVALLDTTTLELTNVQRLPDQMRPFLKQVLYQSSSERATSHHGAVFRLFTFPNSSNRPDSFILVNNNGYSLFSYNGSTWVQERTFDRQGNSTVPQPTPTPHPTPAPTPTPSGSPSPSPSSPPPALPGDINNDSRVDIFDYNLLVADFGKTTPTPADIDRNGRVDIFDYNILVGNFGK